MTKYVALLAAFAAVAFVGAATANNGGHGKSTTSSTSTTIDATAPEQDFSALESLVKDTPRDDVVGDGGSAYCGPSNNGAQLFTNQDPWWPGIWLTLTCAYRVRWSFLYYNGGYFAEWSGYDYGWAWH